MTRGVSTGRMDLRKVLRALLLTDAGLAILVIVQGVMGRGLLPPELRRFQAERAKADLSMLEEATLVVGLLGVVLVVIAWIGLWRFRRWGRSAYTFGWAICMAAAVFRGPTIASWLGQLVETLGVLNGGLILGIAWLSDLRHRFGKGEPADPEIAAPAAAHGRRRDPESATRGTVKAHLFAGGLVVLSIASLGSAYLFPIVIRDSAKGPGPAAFSASLILAGTTLFALVVWLLLYLPASMLADRMTKQRLGRLAWSSLLCVAVLWAAILALVLWSDRRPHPLSLTVLLLGAVVVGFGGGIYAFLRSWVMDRSDRERGLAR